MKLPVEGLVRLGRLAPLLGRTWRYRDARRPERAPDRRLGPAVYALWHEHLLPLSLLHAGQGAAVLASRHRDGEILSRLLIRLGYLPARGSSTRGGSTALRQMIRAGRAGRPLAFTPDGPRGPARRCKPGVAKAAAATGLPVIPVGLAATRGWRLSSWDRFLVPAPGAKLYVSYGSPIRVLGSGEVGLETAVDEIQEALDREVRRCEARAGADGRDRASRDRREVRSGPSPRRAPAPRRSVGTLGRAIEARAREEWTAPPAAVTRLGAALFGMASEARHCLYDAGVLAGRPAPIPVVSVGGLTVGGGGKTPIASELAGWLAERHRVGIVTRGYTDELRLHRAWRPEAIVRGSPDRIRAVRAAAAAGATVAVLDDGFQHRRLRRDLDLVVVDLDALRRTNRRRLPAGPFRERGGALTRAQALVVSWREPAPAALDRLLDWLARRLPDVPVARCALRPGRLVPANAAARDGAAPHPRLALTAIMKPNLFFRQLAASHPEITRRVALPDHTVPTPEELERYVASAEAGGIVMTRKDAVRLAERLPAAPPIWWLSERLVWKGGARELRRALFAAAPNDGGP